MYWKVTAVFAMAAVVMYYLRGDEFRPGTFVTLVANLCPLFDGQLGISYIIVLYICRFEAIFFQLIARD